MKLFSILRRFNFWQLINLSGLMIQRPLRIIPVIKATQRTMQVCDEYFGTVHHQNGPANAFRHALWNILICQRVFDVIKNIDASKLWAKRVTSLHEKLAPNPPLATAMDLHNNQVGRIYFEDLKDADETAIIVFLKEKLSVVKLVAEISQIDVCTAEMVYIKDEG